MIFQDPLSSMHPFYTVGNQIIEAYRIHHDVEQDRWPAAHAIEMLDRVGIPQPDKRVDDYPHQFSGGMRQRAMIAMALSATRSCSSPTSRPPRSTSPSRRRSST